MIRLRTGSALLLVVAVALMLLARLSHRAMGDLETWSGWLLFFTTGMLALYGARKRLPFLPLGRTSSWLGLHLGIGGLAIGIFGVHTGFALPAGPFEQFLWLCFVALAISGVLGWGIVRVGPRLLPARDAEPLNSEIHELRNALIHRAKRLAEEIPADESASALTALYHDSVVPWLGSTPTGLGAASRRRHAAILRQCQGLRRYLHDDSRRVLLGLEEILEERQRIDLAWRRHRLLRGWLLVHAPLTGILILAAVLHVLLVRSHAAAGPG